MSLSNFIPTVWAANILKAYEKAHVVAGLANREYEGDIRGAGDRVQINSIGAITVSSYSKNTDLDSPQSLSDAGTWLNIDQQNSFNFQIDDIDKAQTKPKTMQEAARKAGYALRDTYETYIMGKYAQAGLSVGSYTNAAPADVTSVNVEDVIAELGETFDSNNFPTDGRFAIIPPWFHTKMWLAGITTKTANDVMYANGKVGMVNNIDFIMSNNVSKNSSSWDKSRIMCGIKGESLWLAEQIVSVEAYRMEKRFADALKGLHVFGSKWRADATICLYADKTAES